MIEGSFMKDQSGGQVRSTNEKVHETRGVGMTDAVCRQAQKKEYLRVEDLTTSQLDDELSTEQKKAYRNEENRIKMKRDNSISEMYSNPYISSEDYPTFQKAIDSEYETELQKLQTYKRRGVLTNRANGQVPEQTKIREETKADLYCTKNMDTAPEDMRWRGTFFIPESKDEKPDVMMKYEEIQSSGQTQSSTQSLSFNAAGLTLTDESKHGESERLAVENTPVRCYLEEKK